MAKKGKISESKTKFVYLAGDLSQGAPINKTSARERIAVPASAIDVGDIVLRARADIPDIHIDAGDLLIVERRQPGRASTGELVIVLVNDRVFIGHWWAKHAKRALLDGELEPLTADGVMQILGAVTVILRWR